MRRTPLLVNPPGSQTARSPSLTAEFTAEAVSFRAIDESGWDRPGSDEVLTEGPNNLITWYDDVDPGETRTFGPQERCITPRSKCDVHGVSRILRFEVAFFEGGFLPWEVLSRNYAGLPPAVTVVGHANRTMT